jgi:hypothetical protein
VNGVGYGMTLNDCKVTGFRGVFGPAERGGVAVGWNIVGVSGSPVDSMETLTAALVTARAAALSCALCCVCWQNLSPGPFHFAGSGARRGARGLPV